MHHVSSRTRSHSSAAGASALAVAALAATVLLIRSLPDLVRYLRVRRM